MPDTARDLLRSANRLVLSTHTRPDADAIGSELALARFLRGEGKNVEIINHDPAPYNLDWMPGNESIRVYDGSLEQLEIIDAADLIVILDTNAEHRLGDVGQFLRNASAHKMLIDHHTDPEDWFDLQIVRESASSAGELVYEILAAWDADRIDHDIALALYTAIMTDTGSFRFSNVTPELHRITADLIERGSLDVSVIYSDVNDRKSLEGLHLLGRVLESIELAYGGVLATAVVSRRSMSSTGASSEETDGFVNQLLSIDGVRVAALLTETEKGTKISFRSKGDIYVHKWAQSLGGGGHRNASGAFVSDTLDAVRRSVVKSAPKYLDLDSSEDDEVDPEDAEYLSSLMDMNTRTSHS